MRPGVPDQPSDDGTPLGAQERLWVTEILAAARGIDPEQVPEALCRACVGVLPVTGASVSIAGGPSVRATWCASDRTAARLAEAPYTLGDGPSQSVLEDAAAVLAADLTQGPDSRRWPVFAGEAVELGARAVFSLPLGVGRTTIGTLDLHRDRPGGLSASDLRIALWTRDAVTFAIMNLQPGHDAGERPAQEGVAPWMEASEADHREVHQAVGMVMVQLDLDPEQALDRMRARAFAESRTVSEVAHDIVLHRFGVASVPGGGRDTDAGRRGTGEDGRAGDR
ncbi:GAF and ANTAR domain-containing protein [Streptomyces sp. NPDC059597]|uniref:GAF and ANTAR domain-containing protein n=1 Tax=Streptomyces sp. NPDC059597 TaxID=3346879 RepID=UPI00369AFDD7